MISRKDIEKILSNMDADAREMFLALEREEQLIIIFSMSASNSNRLAVVEKRQIDLEDNLLKYRAKREIAESHHNDDIVSITEKIVKVLAETKAKEFNTWTYIRDRILPNVLSPMIIILLIIIFSNWKP